MRQVKPISGQLPDSWQELRPSIPESSGTVLTAGSYWLLRLALNGKPVIGRGGRHLMTEIECEAKQQGLTRYPTGAE